MIRELESEQVKAKQRQQESTAKKQQRAKQHLAIQSIKERKGPVPVVTTANVTVTDLAEATYKPPPLQFNTSRYNMIVSCQLP